MATMYRRREDPTVDLPALFEKLAWTLAILACVFWTLALPFLALELIWLAGAFLIVGSVMFLFSLGFGVWLMLRAIWTGRF